MKKATLLMFLVVILSWAALYIQLSWVPSLLRFVLFGSLALSCVAIDIYILRLLNRYYKSLNKSLKKYYAVGILLASIITIMAIWGTMVFGPK